MSDERKIDVEAPGGLSEREFAAFRLGVLRAVLAMYEKLGHELPGLYRQSVETEIRHREYKLEKPEGLFE